MIRSMSRMALSAAGLLFFGSCLTGKEKAAAPEALILSVRCDKPNTLFVTWTSKPADYFTAYWSNDSAKALSEWVKVENLATTTKLYDKNYNPIGYGHEFVNLVNGREYFFRITANLDGATRPSPVESGIPVIQGPDSIKVLSGNRRIILEWKDARPDVRHFVYRSRDGSPAVKLEGGSNGYIDSGVENNIDYQYRITAADSECESNPSATMRSRPTFLSEWDPVAAPAPPPAIAYSYYQAGEKLYEVAYFAQDAFSTRKDLLGIRFTSDLANWGNIPVPDSLTPNARILKHGDTFYLVRSKTTSPWGSAQPKYALDIYRSADLSAWERFESFSNVTLPSLQQALSFDSTVLLFSGPWQCLARDLRSVSCDSASRYLSGQYTNDHEFVRAGDSLFEFELGTYNSMRYASANLSDWGKAYIKWTSVRPEFPPGFYGHNQGSRPEPRKIVWRDGWFYALGDVAEGVLIYSADGIAWDAVWVKPVQPKSYAPKSMIATDEEVRVYLKVDGGAEGWFRARR